MKTEEDEAWEEMERRQGAGGFPAKRAMAADKLHWSDCAVHNGPAYPAGKCDCGVAQRIDDDDDTQDYRKPWRGLTDEQRLAALVAIDPLTARLPRGLKLFAEAIEKLLKDQNV